MPITWIPSKESTKYDLERTTTQAWGNAEEQFWGGVVVLEVEDEELDPRLVDAVVEELELAEVDDVVRLNDDESELLWVVDLLPPVDRATPIPAAATTTRTAIPITATLPIPPLVLGTFVESDFFFRYLIPESKNQ